MKTSRSAAKKNRPHTGLFITFEGTEGSGKSTQCGLLARSLRSQGYPVLETREPGGTPLAESIRHLLLSPSRQKKPREELIVPECETLLILAARAQHVSEIVQPALRQGLIVLCDRFFDSTVAYQGYARGLDMSFLAHAQKFATHDLQPHLTFLLDLPIKEGLTRRHQSSDQNRLDRESHAFHQKVRRGFRALAKQEPDRIHTLDARKPTQDLTSIIESITLEYIHETRIKARPRSQR